MLLSTKIDHAGNIDNSELINRDVQTRPRPANQLSVLTWNTASHHVSLYSSPCCALIGCSVLGPTLTDERYAKYWQNFELLRSTESCDPSF